MSVYTEVERDQLVAFLDDYAMGELVSYEGISDGIENTNYFAPQKCFLQESLSNNFCLKSIN